MYSSSAAKIQEWNVQPDTLAVTIQVLIGADASHLDLALAYCRHGIPVFPLRPETKTPYMKGGHHLATTDEATIFQWWREWPKAMVGIPAGPPSGLWILDLDERTAQSKLAKPCLGITALRSLGFEPSAWRRTASCFSAAPRTSRPKPRR
jgi:hypothetical protein